MTAHPMAATAAEVTSLPPRINGFLAMNAECMLFVGHLGATSMRTMGSVTIYISVDQPFMLQRERGAWQECDCAILPPRVTHQIAAPGTLIGVLIEPESIDFANLSAHAGNGADCNAQLAQLRDRLRTFERSVQDVINYSILPGDALEAVLYGNGLERKKIDPRIRTILDKIDICADEPLSAEQCADLTGLSFSRFLHLFKEEVGLSFRCFKAWKRARRMFYFVHKSPNLTDIALEIGYPDSSHFSHSIRQVYGLRPKDIFARSRRIGLHTYPAAAARMAA